MTSLSEHLVRIRIATWGSPRCWSWSNPRLSSSKADGKKPPTYSFFPGCTSNNRVPSVAYSNPLEVLRNPIRSYKIGSVDSL